jgi:hypothetical protein
MSINRLFHEILAFLFLACVGACLGAGGIWVNMKITPWRKQHLPSSKRWQNVGQVLAFTVLTLTLW